MTAPRAVERMQARATLRIKGEAFAATMTVEVRLLGGTATAFLQCKNVLYKKRSDRGSRKRGHTESLLISNGGLGAQRSAFFALQAQLAAPKAEAHHQGNCHSEHDEHRLGGDDVRW